MAKPVSAASTLFSTLLAALLLFNGCATTRPTGAGGPNPPPPGGKSEDKSPRSIPSTVFAIDKKGNHILGGNYAGELQIGKPVPDVSQPGGRPPGPDAPKPEDPSNGYVAKLSPKGELMWSVDFGGAGDQRITGIAVDAANGLIVSGVFNQTVTLGDQRLERTNRDPLMLSAAFVAKVDENGKGVWLRPLAEANAIESVTIAISPEGTPHVNVAFLGRLEVDGKLTETIRGRGVAVFSLTESGQPTPLYAYSLGVLDCINIVCLFLPHCCNCCWDQTCVLYAKALCGW